MADAKSEVLQGTLDLMILNALEGLGPLHGYGIARRLEQISEGLFHLNEGTVYAALLRLSQKGWVTSKGGLRKTIAKPGSTPSRKRGASSWPEKLRIGNASRA